MLSNFQGPRLGPNVSDLLETISMAISALSLALSPAIELFGLQE
jgi:hypothetical protein